MIKERYSIEVSDKEVLIYGILSIEEIFDFMNYFDKQGFVQAIPGDQNSTLRLCKDNLDSVRKETLEELEKGRLQSIKNINETLESQGCIPLEHKINPKF